jgi:hypothetical protein
VRIFTTLERKENSHDKKEFKPLIYKKLDRTFDARLG